MEALDLPSASAPAPAPALNFSSAPWSFPCPCPRVPLTCSGAAGLQYREIDVGTGRAATLGSMCEITFTVYRYVGGGRRGHAVCALEGLGFCTS